MRANSPRLEPRSPGYRLEHRALNDRLRIAIDRRPHLITPHDRKIPCTIRESWNPGILSDPATTP
jgi:hypothetical protein